MTDQHRNDRPFLREIVLIRHGESLANVAAARADADGSETIDAPARDADVELSETGESQAATLAAPLRALVDDSTEVWSSTYRRARQTIEIGLAQAEIEDHPVRLDERLRDRELGILDLLTSLGVARRFPDEQRRRDWLGKFSYRAPGGESWADVALRLRSFLRDVEAVDDIAETPPGRLVIATHDAIVTLFVYVCTGLTEADLLDFASHHLVANASVTTLTRATRGGSWSLASFSDVTHLETVGETVTAHPGDRNDT